MIRFIIVAITVIGFLILSIPILLIEWIIGKFSPRTKEISSLRIVQGVFKFILWEAGTKVTIIGEENVPKDTPLSDPYRLHCQERNGALSASFQLDEISSLSVS